MADKATSPGVTAQVSQPIWDKVADLLGKDEVQAIRAKDPRMDDQIALFLSKPEDLFRQVPWYASHVEHMTWNNALHLLHNCAPPVGDDLRSEVFDMLFAIEDRLVDIHGSKCTCGCGCDVRHHDPYSGYCRRCQAGDCPDPDEKVPENCPHCGKRSNLAKIQEFGWCLSDTCSHPRNTPAWRLAMRRGY